ncbi:MAG: ParB N-terminal domain-containing protein [Spirochaetaceae bacterium]|nr:MAG: ParB N-terminal domain-containing protein [Spirochaetaceae bacterium]
MMVSPDSITVRKRIRKDLGDLNGLMDSLQTHGQLTPIIINRNYELLAGFRRLQAVKRLGWKSIEAVMIDKATEQQKLEIEMEENIQRLELSSEELADGMARLQKLRYPGLFARIWNFILRIVRAIFAGKRQRK